jgi:hypothetical protein
MEEERISNVPRRPGIGRIKKNYVWPRATGERENSTLAYDSRINMGLRACLSMNFCRILHGTSSKKTYPGKLSLKPVTVTTIPSATLRVGAMRKRRSSILHN